MDRLCKERYAQEAKFEYSPNTIPKLLQADTSSNMIDSIAIHL